MAELLWLTIVGPVVDSAKFAGIITRSALHIRASIFCRNLGTKFIRLFIVIVIWQSAKACHIGSLSVTVSSVLDDDASAIRSWHIRSMFVMLAFSTQTFAALRISTWTSHSIALVWLRVVTCWTFVVMVQSIPFPYCVMGTESCNGLDVGK